MAIKLNVNHKKGNLCIDDNITAVLQYYRKNYEYLYTNGLNFKYSPKLEQGEHVLGHMRTFCMYSLGKQETLEELSYLQELFGIETKIIYNENITKPALKNLIKNSIDNNNPVCLFLDTYYVPWHNYFEQFHMPHSFLVNDYNDNSNCLICTDNYLCEDHAMLPYEKISFCTNIVIFNKLESKSCISIKDVLLQIINGLECCNKLKNSDSIREFSDDVRSISIYNKEKEMYQDLNSSQFLFGLKCIEYGRKNISDMFSYMSKEFLLLEDKFIWLSQRLNFISEQWHLVIVFIIKGFYSNKISFYAEKAANLLIEIAENEEKVSHTILSMYEMDIS